MAARSVLIRDGVEISVETEESLSPFGDGCDVPGRYRADDMFRIRSSGREWGAETVRDAIAGFDCTDAVELEGGAAACLFLDGERLLPSIGEYVPLSCVGLLR